MAKKKRRKISKMEFSKRLVLGLFIYAVFFTTWAFILMTVGMAVDSAIVVAIVGGLFGEFGVYAIKAYLGKRNEESNKLERELWEGENL